MDIVTDKEFQANCIKTLKACRERDMVDVKDISFVDSLLVQYATKGTLSSNQWPWVQKKMNKALGLEDDKPKSDQRPVGDTSKIYELFTKAKLKLKKPALVFESNGVPLKLYTKPTTAAKHGFIVQLVYKDKYPGFIGTIFDNGTLKFGKHVVDELKPAFHAFVKSFSTDPIAFAKKYGHMHNRCCFCNTELTDPKSVGAGYGPVCAKNWGMPWGKQAYGEIE